MRRGPRQARGRAVDGILLLDKPIDMTSNAALQRTKRLLDARKAGHTGTLDPLASGLLPLCIGEATKLSRFILSADKHYQVTARLGVITETGDRDGEVLEERPVEQYDSARIEAALQPFRGDIMQVPPMYSAVKQGGTPLYKLARQGQVVEREPRAVSVYELTAGAQRGDSIDFEISCSKGTYVRTLIEDIGLELGCGAHVSALRRTRTGPFDVRDAHTLDAIDRLAQEGPERCDALLLPLDRALDHLPRVTIHPGAVRALRAGQTVPARDAREGEWVAIYEAGQIAGPGGCLGVGEVLETGMITPRRLMRTARRPQPFDAD